MSIPKLHPNDDRPSEEGLFYVRLHTSSVMFLVEIHKHGEHLFTKTLGKRNMDPMLFNQVHSQRIDRIEGIWYGPLGEPNEE